MGALCRGLRTPLRQEEPPTALAITWCKMWPSPGVPWWGVLLVTPPCLPSLGGVGPYKHPCQCLHAQVSLQDATTPSFDGSVTCRTQFPGFLECLGACLPHGLEIFAGW